MAGDAQRAAGGSCGGQRAGHLLHLGIGADPQEHFGGPVAEDIGLCVQTGAVLGGAELPLPPAGVVGHRDLQILQLRSVQQRLGLDGLQQLTDLISGDLRLGGPGRIGDLLPGAEEHHIVRAPGLGAQPDRGLLPAAEGLTLHDRPGDTAVDVGVADLNLLQPLADLVGLQGVDAAGEAELHLILVLNGLVEVLGLHQPQHRSEDLSEVEEAAGLDPGLDAGAPEFAGVVELLGLQQPGFAWFQGGQGALELLCGQFGQRTDSGREVLRPVDHHRLGGIDELAAEALGVVDAADQDAQRGCRAFLTRMAEGGVHQIRHRQVAVCRGGDDQRVLPGGLCVDGQLRVPGAEQRGGLRGAGEDHPVHTRVADQLLAGLTLIGVDPVQHLTGHPGIPECLQDGHGAVRRRLRRLMDDCGSGGQCGEGAACRDGQGKVPRRSDQHQPVRNEPGVVDSIQLQGAVCVVAGKVDGLRDFRIGLDDGLPDLGGSQTEQVPAPGSQDVGSPVEDRGPVCGRPLSPLLGRSAGSLHQRINIGGTHAFGHLLLGQPFGGGPGDDLLSPTLVGLQGGVGVGLVDEGRNA